MNDLHDVFDYKFELLKHEMDALQSGIRSYDSNLFTIKGWAITIFSAFVIFSLQANQPLYLAFCVVPITLFWLVDAIFKTIQRIYTRRYSKIEQFLQSNEFADAVAKRSFGSFTVNDTGTGFHMKMRDVYWPSIIHSATMLPTSLLYSVMLLMTIGLAILLSVKGP